MRSLFPSSSTPAGGIPAPAFGNVPECHQPSPASLVPEMMVFHDADLHSLLDDGPMLEDVRGHLLVDASYEKWYHQYMLNDGTRIDLDHRDAVHWYLQVENVWEPFPDDQSDVLESAYTDGYDSVEFSTDMMMLLPERQQVCYHTCPP